MLTTKVYRQRRKLPLRGFLIVFLARTLASVEPVEGVATQRFSCQAHTKFLPGIWEDLSRYAKDGITAELITRTWDNHNPLRSQPALKFTIVNGTVLVAGQAELIGRGAVSPWRVHSGAARIADSPSIPGFRRHGCRLSNPELIAFSKRRLTPSSQQFPARFAARFVRELLTYVLVMRDLALTFQLPDVEVRARCFVLAPCSGFIVLVANAILIGNCAATPDIKCVMLGISRGSACLGPCSSPSLCSPSQMNQPADETACPGPS